MPIHFRGFCSLVNIQLIERTLFIRRPQICTDFENYCAFQNLQRAGFLGFTVHDISRLFTPFGLWADYGAFQLKS